MIEQVNSATIHIADEVKSNTKSAVVAGGAGALGGGAVVGAYEAVPELSAKVLVYGAPILAAWMTARKVFTWHKARKPDAPGQAQLDQVQRKYDNLVKSFNALRGKEAING